MYTLIVFNLYRNVYKLYMYKSYMYHLYYVLMPLQLKLYNMYMYK